MWSNNGLIVKDAELLRFTPGDGGRMRKGGQDVNAIRRPIDIDKIKTYLDLYITGNFPDYCELCINDVEWGDVWINSNENGFPDYKIQAENAAKDKDRKVYKINSNWRLSLAP